MLHISRQRDGARCEDRQADLEDVHHSRSAEAAAKSAKGVQHYAPAGGAVWAAPTVDRSGMRSTLGQATPIPPAGKNTDAVMALDMDTGKVLWSVQDTEDDAWLSGCGAGRHVSIRMEFRKTARKPLGPDFDFGASMILRTLPDGHRVLVAGQKSGIVWAHDPDQEGEGAVEGTIGG